MFELLYICQDYTTLRLANSSSLNWLILLNLTPVFRLAAFRLTEIWHQLWSKDDPILYGSWSPYVTLTFRLPISDKTRYLADFKFLAMGEWSSNDCHCHINLYRIFHVSIPLRSWASYLSIHVIILIIYIYDDIWDKKVRYFALSENCCARYASTHFWQNTVFVQIWCFVRNQCNCVALMMCVMWQTSERIHNHNHIHFSATLLTRN